MKKIAIFSLFLLIISSCMPKLDKETLVKCKVYNKIEQIAVDMDPNKNKHIDRDEYIDYLVMRFHKSDMDKNNVHDYNEFMEMFTSNYIKNGEKLQAGCEGIMKKVNKKGDFSFKVIDEDDSGEIEMNEFVEQHKKIFKWVDYNNNDLLEPKELITFML